jgi:hypothetical protein
MELPSVKSRVISFRRVKDEEVGQSIQKFDRSGLGMEIYRLDGNEDVRKANKYLKRMKKYMEMFSAKRIVRNTRKEIRNWKRIRGFSTPTPGFSSQYSKSKYSMLALL